MKYISTRDNFAPVEASEAIVRGMVPAGGLFVPDSVPSVSADDLKALVGASYQTVAKTILARYLSDFTAQEIDEMVDSAYNKNNFDSDKVAPVVKVKDGLYVLELWHGPTAAFKDMALQLLPYLLVRSMRKMNVDKEVVILVATSGDTGKAALEGFKDVDGTSIIVFYPDGGVSEVQELQMLTTGGSNTYTFAVRGNFDDCQRSVKEAFVNKELTDAIDALGCQFSSANSINWGRLLPQIVYYFYAYLQLVDQGAVAFGDKINVTVPTGNFGNILAGWYARQMGLPIDRLICASNDNDVLDDFFKTGVYNAKRPFIKTISPSMDILVSSNLERFLYLMDDKNGAEVESWMKSLKSEGKFEISDALRQRIAAVLSSGSVNEEGTRSVIHDVFEETGYLLDTHTAVGVGVAEAYDSKEVMVVDSTANPYKFVGAVTHALDGQKPEEDDLDLMQPLADRSGMPVHRALDGLREKPRKERKSIEVSQMNDEILGLIRARKAN
jgi:threonine synthase